MNVQSVKAKEANGAHARGLQLVPKMLRDRGLREAHSHPLVSPGKRNGRFGLSFRVPASQAWKYPSLELRSANAWTAMILDCDTRQSVTELHDAITSSEIPWPSWIVLRPANGHCHVVYLLNRPVLRGECAREDPQEFAANINEYYRHRLKADPGYTGVLTHNPLPVHKGELVTKWGVDEPYELNKLAKIIPVGWKKPVVATTGIGRNCDLFKACMKWAGSPTNAGLDVLPAAISANQSIVGPQRPLPHSEVASIARSVERYRHRWAARGQFDRRGDQARSEWGKALNARSVQARRSKNSERDVQIVEAFHEGQSQRAIACRFEISKTAVSNVITRDVHGVVQ